MSSTEYIELRHFNNSKTTQNAVLSNYRMLPIINNTHHCTLDTIRFDADNEKIPIFIPQIKKPMADLGRDEKDNLREFVNHSPQWNLFVGRNCEEFNTNLQMMVEYNSTPNNINTAKTARCNYLNWKNGDYNLIGYENKKRALCGTNFSKEITLQDDFYHCFSLQHFSNLLNDTLQYIFQPLDGYFTSGEKVECGVLNNKLIITFPQNALDFDFRIIINEELKNIIGFHAVPHETLQNAYTIVIKKGVIQRYNDGLKWVVGEIYRPSLMFPYKSILFTSNDLQIRPMKRYNNKIYDGRQRAQIITDLLLVVENGDEFYDVMSFAPQRHNRHVNIDNSDNIKNINIEVLLETADGMQTPLKLEPYNSCGILLKITAE